MYYKIYKMVKRKDYFVSLYTSSNYASYQFLKIIDN